MAKKDSTDLTVEKKLEALFQLQTTLSQIDEKRALRGELPLEVEALEDEIAGLRTRIEKIENEIQQIKDAITQKKREIGEAEINVAHYKAQLEDARNNREYDMLSKEIVFQELEIELCNKKIREALVKIEECEAQLKQNQELVEFREQTLEEKKGALDAIIQETKEEEEKLKEKSKQLEDKIEERLLNSFMRIRHNARNGLGVVYVQRDSCGGCFNKIPPQRQLDIKMHKKIIVCEYCGRILIDSELAGIKTTVEEKPKKTPSKGGSKKKQDKDKEKT